MKLLNLGCGATRPGEPWTNLDELHSTLLPGTPERANLDAETNYVNHDITKPLPFEDNTFDGVLMSHVLEHFDCQEGVAIMRECRRVLKVGSELLVSVPDAHAFCGDEHLDTPENSVARFGEPIHPDDGETTFFGYALWNRYHKAIFSSTTLSSYFRRADFGNPMRINPEWVSASMRDPQFDNTSSVLMTDQLNRLKFSLIMVGIKKDSK